MNPEAIADGIEILIRDEVKQQYLQGYLSTHEYGNQAEVKKYIELFSE